MITAMHLLYYANHTNQIIVGCLSVNNTPYNSPTHRKPYALRPNPMPPCTLSPSPKHSPNPSPAPKSPNSSHNPTTIPSTLGTALGHAPSTCASVSSPPQTPRYHPTAQPGPPEGTCPLHSRQMPSTTVRGTPGASSSPQVTPTCTPVPRSVPIP